jgi:DNA-binding NarL/FixJ family response regulator
MLEAIRELYEGGAPMSSQIARKVVAAFQQQQSQHTINDSEKLHELTAREMEILELLSKGLMYKEIASQTFLSPETVRKHVYHIYEKLHVTNRVAAVNKFYGR